MLRVTSGFKLCKLFYLRGAFYIIYDQNVKLIGVSDSILLVSEYAAM